MIPRLSLTALAAVLTLSNPVSAAPPAVVTDIPVVGALARQVLGDLARPEVLLDSGADPHHFQLRPSQARQLQQAGLLIWIGPEMSPWLTRTAESLDPGVSLPLLAQAGTTLRHYGAGPEEAEGLEGHAAHADHDDHGDHDGTDPHAWLDPDNAAIWLHAIAGALAEKDPENAAIYRANAETGIRRIAELDKQLRALLAPLHDRHFAVLHDAYGYFTAHYGLAPAVAVSLGDATAPSAARLKEVQDRIRHENVTCAFPEAGHDPKLLRIAIEGTPARLGPSLNPEGTGLDPESGLYETVLENLAASIATCLGAK